MSELIHFVHGNGFPSPCYKQFLSHLETRYDCAYIDRVGHNPNFPVLDNWQSLVDEVILSIQSKAAKPVIGVGHSLGGVLSLLAAIQKPALFKAVVLLDSPLIDRVKSNILRLSKMLGFIDRLTPAHRTRGRRRHWHSREEALSYLKSRELFKHFTDACLNDYINHGLQKDESGYTLRFNPEIEYQIFRTIPHALHEYEGKLTRPAALIHGKQSTVITRSELHHMKKRYGIVCYETNGSHMFPMEYPIEAASMVFNALDAMKK